MEKPSSSRKPLVRVQGRHPLSGSKTADVLSAVREVLQLGKVQKIVIEAGIPFVLFERLSEESEPSEEDIGMSLFESIRNREMEEYVVPDGRKPSESLLDIFRWINSKGLEVSHILLNQPKLLSAWLYGDEKFQDPFSRWNRLLGVQVHEVKELPSGVVVFCGAATKDSKPEDILFSVKVTLS